MESNHDDIQEEELENIENEREINIRNNTNQDQNQRKPNPEEMDQLLSDKYIEFGNTVVVIKSGMIKKAIVAGLNFNDGQKICDIATDQDCKQPTIVNHLFHFVLLGYPLKPSPHNIPGGYTPMLEQQLFHCFNTLGYEETKPIFQALENKISYDLIKIARIFYLSKLLTLSSSSS